jgi:hypothetical protein
MVRRPAPRRAQLGQGLMVMLVIIVLGMSSLYVSRLGDFNSVFVRQRANNGKALNQAKQALIGWAAQQASESPENNPGRLPCPEAVNAIGSSSEGISAPMISPSTPNCSMVGRLPWRTLGLDKLVDAASEPLWYVVSPGWTLQNSSSLLSINSNTKGQLVVDGTAAPNEIIALIIAPGPAMNVQASAGCTARAQSRAAPSPTINPADYIECFNSGTSTFSTTGPSTSFNDQVVTITTSDLLPQIEAAVAYRFARDIAPAIRTMYSGGSWPNTPVLPFAAPFGNPASSTLQGSATACGGGPCTQGLLPLTYSETTPKSGVSCNTTGNPQCNPTFVAWKNSPSPTVSQTGGATLYTYSCSATGTSITCTMYGYSLLSIFGGSSTLNFNFQASAQNVGMSLRQFNMSAAALSGFDGTPIASGSINADGSATVTLAGSASTTSGGSIVSNLLCALTGILGLFNTCYKYAITVPITVLADHPLLNPNDATYGWFLRNNWDQVMYYAIAPGIAPSGTTPRSCTTGSTCLSVTAGTTSNNVRSLTVFSGRSLTGAARPNSTLSDWLEGNNYVSACTYYAVPSPPCPTGSPNSVFAVRSPSLVVNRTFNDRIAIIDTN